LPAAPVNSAHGRTGNAADTDFSLQQVLSPQLQHSLLILQTPLLELRNLVQQEMETNPVLEELPEEVRTDERGEAELPRTTISTTNSKAGEPG